LKWVIVGADFTCVIVTRFVNGIGAVSIVTPLTTYEPSTYTFCRSEMRERYG
jgi:hypothetical protein